GRVRSRPVSPAAFGCPAPRSLRSALAPAVAGEPAGGPPKVPGWLARPLVARLRARSASAPHENAPQAPRFRGDPAAQPAVCPGVALRRAAGLRYPLAAPRGPLLHDEGAVHVGVVLAGDVVRAGRGRREERRGAAALHVGVELAAVLTRGNRVLRAVLVHDLDRRAWGDRGGHRVLEPLDVDLRGATAGSGAGRRCAAGLGGGAPAAGGGGRAGPGVVVRRAPRNRPPAPPPPPPPPPPAPP